jgi:GNAT superfamily N-acetyltransferase
VTIRDFAAADAQAAADVVRPLQPGFVVTPASLVHELARPPRTRRRAWVAGGRGVVGYAISGLKWIGESGSGRLWVGVAAQARGRGIGSALYDLAEAHARQQGANRLSVEIDADPAGVAFAERRGFERVRSDVVSSIDPRAAETSELEALQTSAAAAGFELVPLRAVRERRLELAQFYEAAGAWPPLANVSAPVTPEDLWSTVFEHPSLEWDGSFVVLDRGGRIASFASLAVDRQLARAEHDWTATLPELRGRRLALLVKLATLRWSREHGIREVVTSNAPTNVPMLTLNKRLGYRRLYERVELERNGNGFRANAGST